VRHVVVLLALLFPTLPTWEAAAQPAPRRVSLEEAIALFARHGPGLQVVRADAAAEAGAVRAFAAFPNPIVGVSRESIGDGERSAGETYLTLSQPLRWPWAGSARGRAAAAARQAATARVHADSLQQVHGVQQAYVAAWLAEERLAVLERVAEVVRQAHARGVERLAAGDISGLDQRRLALERWRYERLLSAGELEVESARRALAALILPSSDGSAVAPAGLPEADPGGPVGAVPVQPVLAGHPEVRAAHAARALAVAEADAERALGAPPPTLTAAYKHQDDGLKGLLFGAALPLPLLDRRAGSREVVAAHVAGAEARLTQAERRVADQLQLARARHEVATRHLEQATQPAGEAGRDLLGIAQIAYHEGELDLLDLLATAEAWRELGALAVGARAEYWLSRFELERALGGTGPTISTTGEDAR
jgi:cobalt-zinc-cadmium efflux system outer membrane protein